jgi:hypothetical protein
MLANLIFVNVLVNRIFSKSSSIYLRFGLSLLTTLSIIQFSNTLALLIGLRGVLILGFYIILVFLIILTLYKKSYFKEIKFRINKFFVLNLIYLISLTFSLNQILLVFGDQTWDSNSYHHTITSYLFHYGYWNWLNDSNLVAGYHVFFPPGIHSLFVTPYYIFNSLTASGVSNSIFFIALSFIFQGIVSRGFLRFIAPLLIISIPAIFGQLYNGYLDLAVGTYFFGGLVTVSIFFNKYYIQSSPRKFNYEIFLLGQLFIGNAVMGKLQLTLTFVVLNSIFLLLFIKSKLNNAINRPSTLHLICLVLIFSVSLSPYIRNLIVFGNPLYPFKILSLPSAVTIQELQTNLDERWFPEPWDRGFFSALLESYIFSPLRIAFDQIQVVISKPINFEYEFARSYVFDSPVGGIGTSGPILLLLFLAHLFFHPRKSVFKNIQVSTLLLLSLGLVSLFSISTSWMPRYALGSTLVILIFLLIFYDQNFKDSYLRLGINLSLIISIILSLLGNYERQFKPTIEISKRYHSASNSLFPTLGIANNNVILRNLMRDCPSILIELPRKEFTNWVYSDLDCNKEFNYFQPKRSESNFYEKSNSGDKIIMLLNSHLNSYNPGDLPFIRSDFAILNINVAPYWDSSYLYFPYVYSVSKL